MMPITIAIVVALVAAVVSGAVFFVAGSAYRKKMAEAKIGSAETEAKRIVNDAIKTAEQKRKESIIEAKDQAFQLKTEADKEIKERRAEVSRQENRLDQKENALDKKTEALEKKEEDLKQRSETVEARLAELEQIKLRETEKLETLAGLSQEDAKELLLHRVDDELTHEKAVRVAAYESNMKEDCDNIARNMIGQAISRCAADHSSETTVSVVPLPSDEMKGRIIGREGRNIRALETATGVDLIIDDTPEAITLSSFDQTRREVARMTLERLIADGRIHPARIEETVEKCRRELEVQMKREGEKAVMDLGIHGLHPDLVKLIGRLKYRTSFGQNALNHSMEVAWLSGLMAGELGVNVTLARRAGLLHDIGKALDHEIEGSHVQIGVDICRKYKENPAIIHAIEAHHGDVEPKTPLAFIVQAADAISAARPGARRENVESYIKRLENLEEISSGFDGVEQAFAVQAGREVRIMVQPEKIGDDQVVLLARSIAKKIEDTLDYPGQIKVSVIRESRATEYAK
ncbi:MAG: ribonuclease Y [Faecalibacterium sp.]|jgi:ribonuclease Y|nr:ribonuclease Y [Faecalibacterium sp.]